MKSFTKLIHNNILILPAIIISIGIIVFAIVMYQIEVQKSESIERQQALELEQKQAEKQAEEDRQQKAYILNGLKREKCDREAKETAESSHDIMCRNTGLCKPGEGTYFISNYNDNLKTCLMKEGLN